MTTLLCFSLFDESVYVGWLALRCDGLSADDVSLGLHIGGRQKIQSVDVGRRSAVMISFFVDPKSLLDTVKNTTSVESYLFFKAKERGTSPATESNHDSRTVADPLDIHIPTAPPQSAHHHTHAPTPLALSSWRSTLHRSPISRDNNRGR